MNIRIDRSKCQLVTPHEKYRIDHLDPALKRPLRRLLAAFPDYRADRMYIDAFLTDFFQAYLRVLCKKVL